MWSPLWSLLVCKVPQFSTESYPFRQNIYNILENTLPEVTKNLYYVLSTRRSQIPIFLAPAHGLIIMHSDVNCLLEIGLKSWQ